MEEPTTDSTAALLLLHLPKSALAGIDLLSFTVTPRFHGIKHLPPGFHFAFLGSSTAFSERHGLWFFVPSQGAGDSGGGGGGGGERTVVVAKWDAESETLGLESDTAELLRWRANLGSFWRRGLVAYFQPGGNVGGYEDGGEDEGEDDDDEDDDDDDGVGVDGAEGGRRRRRRRRRRTSKMMKTISDDWARLTSAISTPLLDRILSPHGNGNGSSSDSASHRWVLTSASSAPCDLEDIPGLGVHDGTALQADKELNFLPIDLQRTWPEGATGRERTEAAQDRSWALLDLARRSNPHYPSTSTSPSVSSDEKAPTPLLGELQFSFLMFLTLNNPSCLAQWRRLQALILTCSAAVRSHPGFFARVLAALRLQFLHCRDAEGDLLALAMEESARLQPLLRSFRRGVERGLGALSSVVGGGGEGGGGEEGERDGVAGVLVELDALEEYLQREHGWQGIRRGDGGGGGGGRRRDGKGVLRELRGVEGDGKAGGLLYSYDDDCGRDENRNDDDDDGIDEDGEDEDDELGEYAPQIVHLSPEQQAEILDIRASSEGHLRGC